VSLIEQIKSGALWDFPGGIHPPENKQQSNAAALAYADIADELVLPLKQHIGKAGDLLVSVGDQVKKGQPLTKATSTLMLPIHAPTSGEISAIEPRTTAHPSGLAELSIVIKTDKQDSWGPRPSYIPFMDQTPEQLIEAIRQAGISGLGGAGFPTARKIQSSLTRVEILIINAAECEPYITADDALMRHHAEEIIQGIDVLEHILKPQLVIIGIEDNKPEAVAALELAARDRDFVIRVIPTKYPSGGEKQLIKILTNKEVPAGGIPADIGLVVHNVGTVYAIKRAMIDGEPLLSRVVTLTGQAIKNPRNIWALIGTPISALLAQFGYQADQRLPRLIMGGPMMGFTLPHAEVPITKTTNCILAPRASEIAANFNEQACIRCGQCAEACPASLLPQQLLWHAKAQEYEKCEELNLKDCIECGACAYVCPSEIPLVQYYRQAKAEIRTREQEAKAADRAKIRFEERKLRLERDKEERDNRFKQAAEHRRQQMADTNGEDAIAAAIARVKAKQSSDNNEQQPVKPAVAAAIARAKAKQAEAKRSGQTEPDNSEMIKLREERKAQAKQRKQEQSENVSPTLNHAADSGESDTADPKKAAVAAAIARAKARKAEQTQAEIKPTVDEQTTSKADNAEHDESTSPSVDPKKAAVAAAIARAKARKAEQTQVEIKPTVDEKTTPKADNAEHNESASPAVDPKKAAVAAAIARAKARKAALPTQHDIPSNQENK
jgi:electron transport complex protein RnfC